MKTSKLSFLTIWALALSFFFSSCDKGKDLTDFSIPDAQNIIDQFNLGKSEMDNGEYWKGSIEIRSVKGEDRVDFLLTTLEGNYIHYILQAENSLSLNREIKNAEVLFFRRSVVINSLDKKQTYLVTIDQEPNELLQNVQFSEVLRGYGLIRYTTGTDNGVNINDDGTLTFRASPSCACCSMVPYPPNPGYPTPAGTYMSCGINSAPSDGCDAGGYSASSCEYTVPGPSGGQCSVTCSGTSGQTNFACCWN